jgi:plasmid maintenance system antidote protein VapI
VCATGRAGAACDRLVAGQSSITREMAATLRSDDDPDMYFLAIN